jgi:hypothetical protein
MATCIFVILLGGGFCAARRLLFQGSLDAEHRGFAVDDEMSLPIILQRGLGNTDPSAGLFRGALFAAAVLIA